MEYPQKSVFNRISNLIQIYLIVWSIQSKFSVDYIKKYAVYYRILEYLYVLEYIRREHNYFIKNKIFAKMQFINSFLKYKYNKTSRFNNKKIFGLV